MGPMRELAPGSRFGGYRIDALAGRGGMGVVFRATQLALGRTVALKLIAPGLLDDPAARRRFLGESRRAAAIDHPNVVPIFDAGEADGFPYLAMRYVEGPDLRQLVRHAGPLEPARAGRIVAQVADGLEAAHAAGLVHRDVKPANVLLGPGEHPYLTDFGITRDGAEPGATGSGTWLGTLDYVAPEQVRGEPLDARADVYGLGGVLFFALTGSAPLPRPTDEARLLACLRETPPAPSRLRTEIPERLDAVTARALAKLPEERYPSARALGRATLDAVGGDLGGAGEAPTATGPPARRAAGSRPTGRIRRSRRRAPRRAGLIGLASVALAGAGVLVARALDEDPAGLPAPPPRIDARFEATSVRGPREPLGDYLRDTHQSRSGYGTALLGQEGYVINVRVRLVGLLGKRLPLRWSMHRADGVRLRGPIYNQVAGELEPNAPDHAATWPVWVPHPERRGRYYVRFVLEDERSRPVDEARTAQVAYPPG